jgi:protein MpaA
MAHFAPNARRIALMAVALTLLSSCATTSRLAGGLAPTTKEGETQGTDASAHAWSAIGYSVERRPLYVAQSGTGPTRIYVVGGVHGDETVGRSRLDALLKSPHYAVTLRVLRDLNPDGTATRRRVNARGLDLNRNWPSANFDPADTGGAAPLSEPETRAAAADLQAFRPDLVVVLHAAANGPFVNYDGPAAELAASFAGAAGTSWPGWHVRPDMGYATPGSLGSYLGVDRNIPILTIEFQQGQDEAAAARALERGLAAVIQSADIALR